MPRRTPPAPGPAARSTRAARGLTLVELATVLALTGVLASLALPSLRDQLARSRRVEATTTLQQLQAAQELFRQQHGHYASQLSQLPGGPWPAQSPSGRYQYDLQAQGPDAYALVARALGDQARDRECDTVTLRVHGTISHHLPGGRCWHS